MYLIKNVISTILIIYLKDIKTLTLTQNPAFSGQAQNVGGYIDDKCSPYICPLIGVEMNDRSKFCFLWKCGCVVSERGLQLGADNKCVNCLMEYEEAEIVVLNPTNEDIPKMKVNLSKRKDMIKIKKNVLKFKQELIIKEEPVDEVVQNEKPIDSSIVTVKTENVNIKTEVKKEEYVDKTADIMKKTKSM